MSKDRHEGRSGKSAAWIVLGVAVAAAIVIIGLGLHRQSDGEGGNSSPGPGATDRPLSLSAWVVDWQWEAGLEDFNAVAPGLDGVQTFAAYFTAGGGLFFTDEDRRALPEVLNAAKRADVKHTLLTVVNDRYGADGSPGVQKDPTLVSKLMATEASRSKHMGDLLEAVDADNFDGIELDYERVPNGDWPNYIQFIGDLYDRLHAEGMTLRVVLEARAPLEKLTLPEGPDYVMMAYNLYGGFSGPGPKADDAFIAKLAARMANLPGDKGIALSLGGFDWTGDRKATAVTEVEAAALSAGQGAEAAERDSASGALHFGYKDADGVKHTVWYADTATLVHWLGVAREAGINDISLWRLGGLSMETKDFIKEQRP